MERRGIGAQIGERGKILRLYPAIGSYYTGFTHDLQDRLCRHNHGRGGRFTSSKRSLRLVYYEEYGDRASAMKREEQIKDFSQNRKKMLIIGFP